LYCTPQHQQVGSPQRPWSFEDIDRYLHTLSQ
jgi:hypothetical protein